jgi:hypothetical protein
LLPTAADQSSGSFLKTKLISGETALGGFRDKPPNALAATSGIGKSWKQMLVRVSRS